MVMQHSLHTLQFWVTKRISTVPSTWRVKASWEVRRLLGSSCSVISWSYFPLVSHKQLFPFCYFPTRIHLLQITICTSRKKSLSCVRRTGFQQSWDMCQGLRSSIFSWRGKTITFFFFLNLSKLHYNESFLVQSWKLCGCNFLGEASSLEVSQAFCWHTLCPGPSGMKGQNKASS